MKWGGEGWSWVGVGCMILKSKLPPQVSCYATRLRKKYDSLRSNSGIICQKHLEHHGTSHIYRLGWVEYSFSLQIGSTRGHSPLPLIPSFFWPRMLVKLTVKWVLFTVDTHCQRIKTCVSFGVRVFWGWRWMMPQSGSMAQTCPDPELIICQTFATLP